MSQIAVPLQKRRTLIARGNGSAQAPRASHPWLGVGARQLAVFDAIVRRRSFRSAARELGYVQSAVSRQVTRLERTVGAQLIERGRGRDGVSLTPAGELLAEHCRTILAQLQAARIDMETVSRHSLPSLHVGVCSGAARWVVPPLIALLAQRRPELRVEFLETANDDLLPSLVERGVLDVAIGVVPAGDRRVTVASMLADPWILLAPADSLSAHRDGTCGAAELRRNSLVLPPRSRATDLATGQLEAAGVSLRHAVRVPLGHSMLAAVIARRGVALTTELSLPTVHPATVVLTSGVTLTPRDIGVFWNSRRRTVDLFECVREAVCDVVHERAGLAIAI